MDVVVSSGKGRATKYKLAKNARVSIPATKLKDRQNCRLYQNKGKKYSV